MTLSIRGSNGSNSAIQVNGTDVIIVTEAGGIILKNSTLAPPIGTGYTRMPGDPLPGDLYPGTTWTKISGTGNLNGTFPRFEGQYSGHEACVYDTVYTSQNKSHGHTGGSTGYMNQNTSHNHSYQVISSENGPNIDARFSLKTNGLNQVGTNKSTNSASMNHTHTYSVTSEGGTESRPVCVGVQHYRRTA